MPNAVSNIPQEVRDALLLNPQYLRELKLKIGRNPLAEWSRLDPNTQMMIIQDLELKGAPYTHSKLAYIGTQARTNLELREGRDLPREALIPDKHRPREEDEFGSLDDKQRVEFVNAVLQGPQNRDHFTSPSMNSLPRLSARDKLKGTIKIASLWR